MCKVVCLVLFALLSLQTINGEKYNLGTCPIIDPLPDFNISDFLGLWYVIQKPSTQSCLVYNITSRYEPDRFDMTSVELYTRLLTRTHRESRTTRILTVKGPTTDSTMRLEPSTSFSTPSTVTVFMADNSYVAIFVCRELLVGHRWSAEILSRTPKLDLDVVDKIRTRLSSYNIEVFKMSMIRHEGCPDYGGNGRWLDDTTDASGVDRTDRRNRNIGDDSASTYKHFQEVNKELAI